MEFNTELFTGTILIEIERIKFENEKYQFKMADIDNMHHAGFNSFAGSGSGCLSQRKKPDRNAAGVKP